MYIDFLLRYEKEILNYNAFSYQHIDGKDCQTWQEVFLLDMLRVSFKKKVYSLCFREKVDLFQMYPCGIRIF